MELEKGYKTSFNN